MNHVHNNSFQFPSEYHRRVFICNKKGDGVLKTKRADHYGAKSSFQKAKKIIFSTQTICGICGRPVDFDKKFPDPWSATVDHIIPVAKGGDPASLENLQLAHLQCNRIKSSKLVQPQLKEKTIDNRDLPLSFDWASI